MTADEKQKLRRAIEMRLDKTVLGSPQWVTTMRELMAFDRQHPNIWKDDE